LWAGVLGAKTTKGATLGFIGAEEDVTRFLQGKGAAFDPPIDKLKGNDRVRASVHKAPSIELVGWKIPNPRDPQSRVQMNRKPLKRGVRCAWTEGVTEVKPSRPVPDFGRLQQLVPI
jgi:hypothetical protein